VAVLPEEEIVDVHLVLVMGRGVLLERIAARLVVQHDEFFSFHEDVVHRSPEQVAALILPAYAIEIAPPDREQALVIEKPALAVAFGEFRRQLTLFHEAVEMLLQHAVHAGRQGGEDGIRTLDALGEVQPEAARAVLEQRQA